MARSVTERSNRAEEIRTERRKKPGSTINTGQKLHVPEENLDRANYEYRFANDKGSRVQQLHDEDWDVVSTNVKPDSDGEGSVQSKVVGTTEDGKPMNGVLMRKRKDWYAADQKEKNRVVDEIENQIRRGTNHEQKEPDLRGGDVYTPNGSNSIGS